MKNRLLIAAAAAALLLGGSDRLLAQTPAPSTTTPPPPPRHGLFGRRHIRPMLGGRMPMTGRIIGNRNTHVYHLAGDTGNMPVEKNRVYFRSEAEARAAGYHLAGRRGAGGRSPSSRLPGSRRLGPPTTRTPN